MGPFPLALGQPKFLIVSVNYFTKWIEAEAVAKITADRVKRFYWKKIICKFELPKTIVTDNGTQFASAKVQEFCTKLGIQTKFVKFCTLRRTGRRSQQIRSSSTTSNESLRAPRVFVLNNSTR